MDTLAREKDMKIAQLTDALLDYWVAKAEGQTVRTAQDMGYTPSGSAWFTGEHDERGPVLWSPSTDWEQAGPIIEREGINTTRIANWPPESQWIATHPSAPAKEFRGPTGKVAAMRAYVAAKFGDEVPSETS